MLRRVVRDGAIACGLTAGAAFLWRPDRPLLALGVVGGGALAGLSVWAIRGAVDQVLSAGERGKTRAVSRAGALVKFFTRHAILALAAYIMMLRLRLDPVGMVVGVTSVVVAAAFEARRWR